MELFLNYYSVLDLTQDASEQKIKKAFRALAKTYHPDINPDPEAHTRFLLVEQAYEVLSNPQKRAIFDALLASHSEPAASAMPEPAPSNTQANAESRDPVEASYIFPNFVSASPARFVLQGKSHRLTVQEVDTMMREGMLSGRAGDRQEYLLLYCVRCHALFGTTWVRDTSGIRYYPYEIFPVCPHCRAVEWCPADEAREERERGAEAMREQQSRSRLDAFRQRQPAAQPVLGSAGVRQRGFRPGRRLLLALSALVVVGGGLGLVLAHANQVATQADSATRTASTSQTNATDAASTSTAQAILATARVGAATAQAQATATSAAIAALNPDPSFHTLALSDPLTGNTNGWDESSGLHGEGCAFSGDGYDVTFNFSLLFPICLLRSHSFSDFAYLVHMKIVKGDCGGLIFRSTESANPNMYYVEVCKNGFYDFVRQGGKGPGILLMGTSGAIKQGLNMTNTVAVIAHDPTIALSINRNHIASVTDSTFKSGDIGMMTLKTIGTDSGNDVVAETVYSDLYIWTK